MNARQIRYARGQVTPSQELCLQMHKEYLMDELDGQEVVVRLRSLFVLSSNDQDYILGGSTRREQNGRLVDTIAMRSPKGFEAFLQALQDTGHDAAHRKLANAVQNHQDDSEDEGLDDVAGGESPALPLDGEEVGYLEERVDDLTGAVEALRKHMEVLSMRLTKVDTGRQAEVQRLKHELSEARAEIDRLRGENEELSALVTNRSQELEQARHKISELEQRIADMENDNDHMQRRYREQAKRLDTMAVRSKQAHSKLASLEQDLDTQRLQHKKDMDEQRAHHRRETDQLRRRLDRELDKRRTLEEKMVRLEDHKAASEAALRKFSDRFHQLEENVQQLRNIPGPEKNVSPHSIRGHSEVSKSYPCVNMDPNTSGGRGDKQRMKFPSVYRKGNNRMPPKMKTK